MTDIVGRLREWSECSVFPEQAQYVISEAVCEITTLRAEVERLEMLKQTWRNAYDEEVADSDKLRAENEKLRAALWDIHAVCNNWDWFIWMWPIRRIKRLARAALEEKDG